MIPAILILLVLDLAILWLVSARLSRLERRVQPFLKKDFQECLENLKKGEN